MSFDERLAMIVDAEWDSRQAQQAPALPQAGELWIGYTLWDTFTRD